MKEELKVKRTRIGRRWVATAFVVLLMAGWTSGASAQTAADSAAVRRAVLDYVEGFYEGDTTKLARSVSRSVYKYGYSLRGDAWTGTQMPYEGFMRFANGVRAGRNVPPPNAPKRIELFDVLNQTAAAKLTAWWGTDYLLMGKQDGRWMITHVLWQSTPR